MKKQMKKLCKWSALSLCLAMLASNMQILASSEGIIEPVTEDKHTDESIMEESDHESSIDESILEDIDDSLQENDITENVEEISPAKDAEHDNASEEITVSGLEGIQLDKIAYTGRSAGSCQGFLHNWQVTQTIQEQTCGKQGIWRIKCADCGVTATTFSDIYDHNYDGGICKNCGGIEVAPKDALDTWVYELNDENLTITLTRYFGTAPDLIIYGKYEVNGIEYSTILNGNKTEHLGPLYNRRKIFNSIKINPGVKSYVGSNLFYECSNLTSLDLSSFDTSNVVDMVSMFYGCSSLTSLDLSSFDTSNVVDMLFMFNKCSSLTSLDLSSFDTSNVTRMGYMFNKCSNLTSLDLSSFDTSNVTGTTYMFSECSNLTSLDLSSFNTSKIEQMSSMFSGCSNLVSLDLSSFDTSNTSAIGSIFSGCSSLTSLDLSSFDTSNMGNMAYMFEGCSNLASLDLSSFDTSNVVSMAYMFKGCSNLTSLDLSSFMTNYVDTMDSMFHDCSNLSTIYVSRSWNPTWARTENMFTNCGTSKVTLKQ